MASRQGMAKDPIRIPVRARTRFVDLPPPVRVSGPGKGGGNVHSADGWRDVLDPAIARYAKRDLMRFFRADAAYASPAIYQRLEEVGYYYAIRLPSNAVLRNKVAHLPTRPVGRPSQTRVNASTRISSIGPGAGRKSAT